MGKYRTLQTSFNGGEYDQKLRGRSDVKSYFNGALQMRNFSLYSHGGFYRRYGSSLGPELGLNGRLLPFEFSSEEALLIYIEGGGVATVYGLNGQVAATLTGGEWTTDELFSIKYEQRGNVLFLAHKNWQTKMIRRTGTTAFSLTKYEFYQQPGSLQKMQPYSNTNQSREIKLTVSSYSKSNVTLTSNKDLFNSDWVNTWMKLSDGGYGYITAVANSKSATYNQLAVPARRLLADPITAEAGSSVAKVTMVEHGLSVGSSVRFREFMAVDTLTESVINKTHSITQIIDSNTFKIDFGTNSTESIVGGGLDCWAESLGPTPDWRLQSFGKVMGWPGVVALHQERLFFAATKNEPDTIFATRVADIDVFDLGDSLPADSIQVTLDAGRVNEIRHLVSSRHLQVFTNDAEFFVATPESENVTPENVTIRQQTPYGCSNVRATDFDGATIFFQESGRAVREFLYTDREYAYASRNISLLAQDLIQEPVDVAAIYGSTIRPEKYLFVVNEDGTMAVLHMIREEEMIGWVLWQTDGEYESVAVVGQRIFAVVKRNGKNWLEEFDQNGDITLDGAIYIGDDFTGISEYAGYEVAVIQDGHFEGYADVSLEGTLDLPDYYNNVTIGLNFPCIAETMPAVVSLPDGSLVGLPLRLTRCVVDVAETMALSVDGQRLDIRNTLDSVITPSGNAQDGRIEFQLNTVSRTPTITFTQNVPYASAVYSLTIEVAW